MKPDDMTKIKTHITAILEHRCEVANLLSGFAEQLRGRGIQHDESKLSEPELSGFMEILPELNKQGYQSDEYNKALKSKAIQHHYEVNDHHPEHHKANGMKDMDFAMVIEMLFDWVSAAKRYNSKVNLHKQMERFGFSEDIWYLMRNTLRNMGIDMEDSP